jgi:hypothetical protein
MQCPTDANSNRYGTDVAELGDPGSRTDQATIIYKQEGSASKTKQIQTVCGRTQVTEGYQILDLERSARRSVPEELARPWARKMPVQ